jgi:hypothetical protein
MSRSSRLEHPTRGLPMLLANMEGACINNAIIDPQKPWSPSSLSSHVMHVRRCYVEGVTDRKWGVHAGGVHGGLGAHEWEGKSARTHMNTFGQVHVHIRHHGGTERPEPCARAWFVHVDKSGVCVWSLVVVVLRAPREGGGKAHGQWSEILVKTMLLPCNYTERVLCWVLNNARLT